MAILPEHVTIDPNNSRMLIDGARFPWYISEEGPTISGLGAGQLTKITLSFYAKNVEIRPVGQDQSGNPSREIDG